MYPDAIYRNGKVMLDDVFCNKPKELMDEVDHCITNLESNPAGQNETILLKEDDEFEMKVSFFADHPYAYVYVSDDQGYEAGDSRPFDISHGCGELHDHVARVLSAHTTH